MWHFDDEIENVSGRFVYRGNSLKALRARVERESPICFWQSPCSSLAVFVLLLASYIFLWMMSFEKFPELSKVFNENSLALFCAFVIGVAPFCFYPAHLFNEFRPRWEWRKKFIGLPESAPQEIEMTLGVIRGHLLCRKVFLIQYCKVSPRFFLCIPSCKALEKSELEILDIRFAGILYWADSEWNLFPLEVPDVYAELS